MPPPRSVRLESADRPKPGSITKAALSESSVSKRIERLFLDNLGHIIIRQQIVEVAGADVENWHQRLSELRTDKGYEILSNRDRDWLSPGQYLMLTAERNERAARRVMPTKPCWATVLLKANDKCEWNEGGQVCGLGPGDLDPVGGGTVKLTPDHKTPHHMDPASDPADPDAWQALCGRHQVVKKNYWDSSTGKMNYVAIVQAAPAAAKTEILRILLDYFGYNLEEIDDSKS